MIESRLAQVHHLSAAKEQNEKPVSCATSYTRQDEMLSCPCGTVIEKSYYRKHRYSDLQHVDYVIVLCMLRDHALNGQQEESWRVWMAS